MIKVWLCCADNFVLGFAVIKLKGKAHLNERIYINLIPIRSNFLCVKCRDTDLYPLILALDFKDKDPFF